ncbi:MAG: sigma-70 family RNA polymerase sigma factor [Propionibacteriaceae bacterium]
MNHDEAFAGWAREHSPQLLRRATMLCGDRYRAEDLVQETLVRMFLRWRHIDLDGNALGYAHTTLFRLFLSSRRKRSSTELVSATLPEQPGHDPEVAIHLDLVAALQTLPPKQRCVVVARYLDDRSVSEVATLMHRTESWVRVNAHRALHTLRDSPFMAMTH